jgi:hypothetical protein
VNQQQLLSKRDLHDITEATPKKAIAVCCLVAGTSIDGKAMTLESSVTVFENDDLVSFDKESKKLSYEDDCQAESVRYHEDSCRKILSGNASG